MQHVAIQQQQGVGVVLVVAIPSVLIYIYIQVIARLSRTRLGRLRRTCCGLAKQPGCTRMESMARTVISIVAEALDVKYTWRRSVVAGSSDRVTS